MVFGKTDFLFWGWLKAFLGFEFYKVVAAATMSVMSHLLISYLTSGAMNVDRSDKHYLHNAGLLMLCLVAGFILLKIPAMTAASSPVIPAGMVQAVGMASRTLTRGCRLKEVNMKSETSPDITRAAERYLEQYGDPIVMNTYLKVTILVLGAVCLVLAGLVYKSQRALADMHPMIVRINDVGRAEAIDYRNFQYRPQEAENKYYLSRWAELYFSRNRFTIERDQTNSLYFLNGDVQRAVIEQERKDNVIQNYIKDAALPYVDVEIKNVILDDLRQSPYSARIEFEKVFTNPADHTEIKRERWTASVTYVFRENVKNNELAVNPLGLTIVRFRADQAFS